MNERMYQKHIGTYEQFISPTDRCLYLRIMTEAYYSEAYTTHKACQIDMFL